MMNVSYFAALFARSDEGWIGTEAELAEVETAEDVTDLMREAAVETSGDPVILLLEEDDEWFSVLRMDGEEDPRAFLSDARACSTSRLAGLVSGHTGVVSDDKPDPTGDATLLEDLGVEAESMLRLSDSLAAGDALLEVAETVGFSAEYDRLRA